MVQLLPQLRIQAPAFGRDSVAFPRLLRLLGLLCLLALAFSNRAVRAQGTVTRFNGASSLSNSAVATGRDAAGNTYVTGYAVDPGTGNDIYTVKYDPTGALVWAQTYNGPRNGDDTPAALAVDSAGNVYVTGISAYAVSSSSGNDYITIKYDTDGNLKWAQPYNGAGSSDDQAKAIAVDNSGNVYVTGYTSSGSTQVCATIKYNSAGVAQWTQTYGGSANSAYATAIALDGGGNVIVAGSAYTSATGNDYLLLKYDTNGNGLWNKTVGGTANSVDQANAVAVDSSNNIYVTGYVTNTGTGQDYATLKYDTLGNVAWTAIYSGAAGSADQASAIAIDSSGNVYVTGFATVPGGTAYATIKYDSAGASVWTSLYGGTNNYPSAKASAIAVDSSGNVIVTGQASVGSGTAYATLKYDSGSGNVLWTQTYTGTANSAQATALSVDSSNNIYVTGSANNTGTGFDYATLKYDTGGNPKWTAVTDKSGSGNDNGVAVKADSSGNFYVAGYNAQYFYTLKYAHSGALLWAQSYPASGQVAGIAVDPNGNVAITGYATNLVSPYSGKDYLTIKYDANGNRLWAQPYNGTAYGDDQAKAIGMDSSGNVYVTGQASNSGTGLDYVTFKYDSATGNALWMRVYNGTANSADQATALAVDASGNVVVTGSANNTGTGQTYTTIKYNPSGVAQWTTIASNSGTVNGISATASAATAASIALDGAGNAYVTGTISSSTTGYAYTTSKYDSGTGVSMWTQTYNAGSGSNAYAAAVAVDSAGNVYVTGYTATGFTQLYATVKYNSSGAQQWAQTYGGAVNSAQATAIGVDNSGNVIVTGQTTNSNSATDYATLRYDPNGNVVWTQVYNGTGNSNDTANSLAVDSSGSVYVTGTSFGGITSNDITTIVYDTNPLPVLSSVSPGTANAGGGAITLTLTGSGFVPASQVLWNGATNLTVIYVSPTKLQAIVPSSLTASPTTASLSVFNPALGGGTSGSLNFTVVGAPNLRVTVNSVQRVNGQVQINYTVTNQGTATANNFTVTKLRLVGSASYTVQAAPGGVLQGPTTLAVGSALSGSVTFPSTVAAGNYTFQVYGAYNTTSYTLSTPVTVP